VTENERRLAEALARLLESWFETIEGEWGFTKPQPVGRPVYDDAVSALETVGARVEIVPGGGDYHDDGLRVVLP